MADGQSERILVVNADDFGLSPRVNAGVIEAHERGIVTSASLMVRQPAASEAAAYARRSSLSLGLHLDLGHWELEGGVWTAVYERVPLSDREAVEAELREQLERFRALVGGDPTHLDSHQHVHLDEPMASAARNLSRELHAPLRSESPRIQYLGDFYGQTRKGDPLPDAISVERLVELIEALPEGITELACHPGRDVGPESSYGEERDRELAALCSSRVRAVIARAGVKLRSFADVSPIRPETGPA